MSAAATLYVIPGSHACRAAMLMLEHKDISYRCVKLPTGLHPMLVCALGFPGNDTPIREVDGATARPLAVLDRMGTVPALRFGAERVQTNREIARFLERVRPHPALFPGDPDHRRAVQEVEEWADSDLQMAARRIVLIASGHGLDALRGRGAEGRLGPLLAKREIARAISARVAARAFFGANRAAEEELLAKLPAMLDRIDAWIAAGVIAGPELNAADYMIVPCIALLAYRTDLRAGIEARAVGALLERVLPEPELSS